MALYSINKLINETRRIAAEFKRTNGTMLPVSGEIARYDVSHHLDLKLDEENNGFDAIGNSGRFKDLKVQIKSRVIGESVNSSHRIGQLNPDGQWDVIILSLMDDRFEPLEMYLLSRGQALDVLSLSNKKRGKRGAISVAKFKKVAELVWTKESCKEDDDLYRSCYL